MTISLDSNLLFYAVDAQSSEKHAIARNILERASGADMLLAAQVIGEFLNAVRRKRPRLFVQAQIDAALLASLLPVIPTDRRHVQAAVEFAERSRLQFWDSVIWQVSRSAGATFFVSEDLQDGFNAEGMTVIDPFKPGNAEKLAALMTPEGG